MRKLVHLLPKLPAGTVIEIIYEVSGDADLVALVHVDDTMALRALLDKMWMAAPNEIGSTTTELVLELKARLNIHFFDRTILNSMFSCSLQDYQTFEILQVYMASSTILGIIFIVQMGGHNLAKQVLVRNSL